MGSVGRYLVFKTMWVAAQKYKIGDSLIVNHEELENWIDVTVEYCKIIQGRIEKEVDFKKSKAKS
ncbi:hypothetical protein HQ865_23435 [Mucilaginibacter mali]|uniref:Uncharacterized protein n=1 Tax=Mucilaginibacter mali TaxID=2740462 RepID=A0A7D4PWL9_9SPHI|nr:hypothetical protein [Mucilaginibacter mali]QKJ32588.1 hypothetical protein HQ865_23435 [Mucilaginibacter mali]